MKIEEKTIDLDARLWVEYDGVDVKTAKGRMSLTGRDEDAYLKVFNHFGRLYKLFLFEDGHWVDSETGAAPRPFDEEQAGHLPSAPPAGKAGRAPGKTAKTTTAKKKGNPAKTTAAKKQTAKQPAARAKASK